MVEIMALQGEGVEKHLPRDKAEWRSIRAPRHSMGYVWSDYVDQGPIGR